MSKTPRRANGPKAKAAKTKAKTAKAKTKTKTKTAKAAAPAKAKTGTKNEMLVTMLTKGATVDAMLKALGWLPHTLRASISMLGSKHGMKVERTRTDGVTSYKIA